MLKAEAGGGRVHMIRKTAIVAGLATVLTATPADAQAPAPTADRPRHPAVRLLSQSPARPAQADVHLLRRAQPDGDPRDWLSADDPVVQSFIAAGPNGVTRATVRLEVTGDGSIADCRAETESSAGLGAGLCEALAGRARLIPALNAAGQRIADSFVLSASFEWILVPPRRLVDFAMVAARPPSLDTWPPPYGQPGMTASHLALLPGGGDAPEAYATPWAGTRLQVVRTTRGATIQCEIAASSGDAGFDTRACNAVRAADFRLQAETAPLLFVEAEGRPHALLPVNRSAQEPRPLPVAREALQALSLASLERLSLRLEVDRSGAVTGCTINRTSGQDADDIEACRLALAGARFEPAEDIFGRPRAGLLYSWSPAAQ